MQVSFLQVSFDCVKQESIIVNPFVACCVSDDGSATHGLCTYNRTMQFGDAVWLVLYDLGSSVLDSRHRIGVYSLLQA